MFARAKNICLGHNSLKRYSRLEILKWINEMLQCNIQKIEDLCTGAAYCNLMHIIFPGLINLTRVKFESNQEYEFIANFKELQKCFNHAKVDANVPVAQLIKGHFHDNLEFAVWFRHFFEANFKEDLHSGYDPLAARSQQPIGVGASRSATPMTSTRRGRNIAVTTPRTARTPMTARTARDRNGPLTKTTTKQPEQKKETSEQENEMEGISPRMGKTVPRIHEPGTPLYFLDNNVLALDGVPPPLEGSGPTDDAKQVQKKVVTTTGGRKTPFVARKKPANGRNKVEPPPPMKSDAIDAMAVQVPPLDFSDLAEDKAEQTEISTGGRKSVRGSLNKNNRKKTSPPVEKNKPVLAKSFIVSQDGKVPPLELDGPTEDTVKKSVPGSPYKNDPKNKKMVTTGRNKVEPAKRSLKTDDVVPPLDLDDLTEDKPVKPVTKNPLLKRTLTLVEKWKVPAGGNKVEISGRLPHSARETATATSGRDTTKGYQSVRDRVKQSTPNKIALEKTTLEDWQAKMSEKKAARDIKARINKTKYINKDMIRNKYKDLLINCEKVAKTSEAIESDEDLIEIYKSPMYSYNGRSSATELKKETVDKVEEKEQPQDLGLTNETVQLAKDLLNVLAEREVTDEEALAELRLHDGLHLLIKMPDDGKDVDVALAPLFSTPEHVYDPDV